MAPIGFGILGTLFALKADLFTPEGSWIVPGSVWTAGVFLFGLSWIRPAFLLPFYRLLYGFGWLILSLIGYFSMLLIFFLIMTPVGLFFRIIGRDALSRKPDQNCDSYWIPTKGAAAAESYYHQS